MPKNCPPRTEQVRNKSVKAAIVTIKECEQEKFRQCREMVYELKPGQVQCIQKAKKKKRERPENDCVQTTDESGRKKKYIKI